MMGGKGQSRLDKVALSFEQALTPIFTFAVLNAALCWAAAWFFRETYEFSVILLALGCLPIVVSVSAYLLVLVNKIERGS